MSSPFGIRFYSTITELQVLHDIGQYAYEVVAPGPHPLFKSYFVLSTPSLGIVWVKGITPQIENDNFGSETCATVDRIEMQLTQKYGRPKKRDLLMDGSIWTEPQDWMNGLTNRERFYSYSWKKSAIPQLPEDLDTIYIGAVPHDGLTAEVVLEYASPRLKEAEAELERQMSDLL